MKKKAGFSLKESFIGQKTVGHLFLEQQRFRRRFLGQISLGQMLLIMFCQLRGNRFAGIVSYFRNWVGCVYTMIGIQTPQALGRFSGISKSWALRRSM